jgi:hypothetical protein
MNKVRLSHLAVALMLLSAPSTAVLAQGKPDAADEFEAYLEEFDRRYPDSGQIDVEAVLDAEGERFATLYCRALGIDGPCVPDDKGQYVPAATAATTASRAPAGVWWGWLFNNLFNVGVIPNQWFCPAPYQYTVLRMDDSNIGNTNARGGWLGATLSIPMSTDTTWRLCKLDLWSSLQYRQLNTVGLSYDYAVQNLGVFCPPSSRRVTRIHGNVFGHVTAGSFNFFPSVPAASGWRARTCHFDTILPGATMTTFPTLSMPYGLYASRGLRPPLFPSLANGYVVQDDVGPNSWNWNMVTPLNWVMMDSGPSGTMRFLARVQ